MYITCWYIDCGLMFPVISLLPAEICGWVSVIRLMIKKMPDATNRRKMDIDLLKFLKNFSNNKEKDELLRKGLMDSFNDLTSEFEKQHNEGIKSVEQKISTSTSTKSGSKRKFEETSTELGRGTSLSDILKQKVVYPIDWYKVAFYDRLQKTLEHTNETGNDEGKNKDLQIEETEESIKKEDISRFKDLLNLGELSSELTLE